MSDEPHEVPPEDPRPYLDGYIGLLSNSVAFSQAFDQLIQKGCKRYELAWLLSALTNSKRGNLVSGKELLAVAADFRRAADGVRLLFYSQVWRLVGIDSLKSVDTFLTFAANAEKIAPKVSKKVAPERDLVRATICVYVEKKTGSPTNAAVATVINDAESIPLDGPFSPEIEPEKSYSEDAHAHWRKRPHIEPLFAPASEVADLLSDMDAELKGNC